VKKNHYILLLINLCLAVSGFGQQYNFIKYSISQGLPQSQVYAAHQDSRGYIWFGTQGGGLSRFDGNKFTNFSTKNGLPSNYIQAIYEDDNRQIWVSTKRGICRFTGKKFEPILNEKKPITDAWAFVQKNDSTLWVGTRTGILAYSFSEKKIIQANTKPQLRSAPINQFFDTKKGLWIATDGGAWFVGNNAGVLPPAPSKGGDTDARGSSRREDFPPLEGGRGEDSASKVKQFISPGDKQVQAITADATGNIWMIAFDGHVKIIDENTLLPVREFRERKINKTQCAYSAPDGKIWVGTQKSGIAIYSPQDSSWAQVSEREGLPHSHVRSIIRDKWDNVWIATSGGGVAKYLGQFFIHFNKNNGLHGSRIYALCKARDGQIWFSASDNGVGNYDGFRFQKSGRDSSYIDVKSSVIFEDSRRRLWIGTKEKGIVVLDTIDSLGYRLITEDDGLPSNWIHSIAEDAEGNIWVGTQTNGIAKITEIDSIQAIQVFGKSKLRERRIRALCSDNFGKIWFSTRKGRVGFFEDGKVATIYDKNDGLPRESINSIAFDSLGRTWVGTAGEGIFMLNPEADDAVFEPLKSEEKLTSENIYLLIFDGEGNLWAGSENGVDKITLNQTGTVLDIEHYGKNEGFLGIETCRNAAIADAEGNLWFGTMNGLTKHTVSQKSREVLPPVLHFEDISLFYKSLSETAYSEWFVPSGGLREGLELPYRQNHLSFDFKAINLSAPESIYYRWKLEGVEEEWAPPSMRESVNYSQLLPGEYTFTVQAVTDDNLSSEPISASFFIKKPFWQLRWVQVLAAVLVGLLIFLFVSNRIKTIRRKEGAKRKELELRNHVLSLEQKALQLQMNPHFIFNALNSIQSLVAAKENLTARSQIHKFAALMRSILSNSRKEKITLKEEISTLEKYLRMEQFCQPVPFDFEIQAPTDMDVEEIELPPMLIQPFVENAVIHGISHLQNKRGKLLINFSIEKEKNKTNKLLQCKIQDNGVGRMRAAELRQTKQSGHQSVAMEVTRERLEAMKSNAGYMALDIQDMMNEKGEVLGTQVVVQLPLEVNF